MDKLVVIVGRRGNLSSRLSKIIDKSLLISTDEFIANKTYLKKLKNKSVYLIINSFYPTSKLSHIENYNKYIEQTILNLTKILEIAKKLNISKIIYTSSSSIYNLHKINTFTPETNRDFYALTKFICEKLIIKFSNKHKIQYLITRLFNMYGGNDNFSIISRIINCYNSKKIFQLNNNGDAVRDFIHVDEVSRIYQELIRKKKNEIIDIGYGYGYKISDIISLLGSKKFNLKNRLLIEQKFSISKKNIFKDLKIKENSKLSLKNYLKKELKLKKILNLKKVYYNNSINQRHEIFGTIIYGVGDAGKQVCDLIQNKNKKGVFCFVDDDKRLIDKNYNGIKIISKDKLKKISKEHLIPNIIIAIPSLKNEKLKKLSNELYNYSASVYNLPTKNEYNTDHILLSDLQNSKFLNIFSQKKINSKEKTFKHIENKKILVTGAGGSIGSELVRQLIRIRGVKITCLDISELFLFNLKNSILYNKNKIKYVLGSINDDSVLKKIFTNKIDIIFHAAAYKHLNFLEENPMQGVKNNIIGTHNLIENSVLYSKKKIKMINISTDKAVKPKSILGITKRIAEIICGNYELNSNKHIAISTVRFGNVFGSMGSAISLFIEKINKGENIEITSKKAERYFMSINQACNLVIQASQFKNEYRTYIFDMGKPFNIYSLLKKMIKLKKNYNNNFKIKVNEVGLHKGEKISEQLTLNMNYKKTNSENIFEVVEPQYNHLDIKKLIISIKENLNNDKDHKIILQLKNFIKKEIKYN